METKRLNPIIIDAPQRSPEWFNGRLGKVTGSNVSKTMSYYAITKKHLEAAEIKLGETNEILERLKTEYSVEFCLRAGVELKESAERMNYRRAIVGERLTGVPADPDQFTSYAMKWGVSNEPLARTLYQLKSQSIVADAPFMLHPEWKCGASPDGLVIDPETGLLGCIEIKCLMTANHLYKIIQEKKAPEEYIPQIQMQLWITGRDFCDFVGYDSRLPDGLQILIQRVERDDFYIDEVLAPSIRRFLDECDRDFQHFWAMTTSKGRSTARLISPEFAE